jgi:hypothetical protein
LGFLRGIAQTTFGLSIKAVGMANAFAIFCGLVCLSGSLVPILAFNPADLGPKRKAVEKREKLILFPRKGRGK